MAWDVSQAYQVPQNEPHPMYIPPMGGITEFQLKQEELQKEVDNLVKTQNYLIEVIEEKKDQLEMTKEAHKELSHQFYALEDEIEEEKGRNQCYKLQLEELGNTLSKERTKHIQELNDERCYSYEMHLLKEQEVGTAKRAMAMTRRQLQQAKDTI